jgi:DNA polymerase-3 subunit delta
MINRWIEQEIKRKMPEPLYYIHSDESPVVEELLKKAADAVFEKGQKDFNYNVFDKTSTTQKIIDTALTLPFLASRRFVIIRNFDELTAGQKKALVPYLKNPSPGTCMIVISSQFLKAGKEKIPWKVFSLKVNDNDIPRWITQNASERGITLTPDAVETLIEFVGTDTGLLSAELDKIALSEKKYIYKDDIKDLSGFMRDYGVFDLVDALIVKDKDRAFTILKALLDSGSAAPESILGAIVWHYGQFYTLWLNKGKRPLKMREKTYRILSCYLRDCSEDYFFEIFKNLHDTDVKIKTTGRPEIALEILLLNLLKPQLQKQRY